MRKSEKYLSKSSTQCLKGIFTVGVLLHHLYQYSGVNVLNINFQSWGYLSVAMFFFIMGYGLMISAQKQDYVKLFVKRRIIPLYLFYIVLIGIYWGWKMLLNIEIPVTEIVQSFLFGKTIVPLGWYLQTTFVIYIVYWIVFKNVQKKYMCILCMGGALVVYSVACIGLGLPSTWYQGVFCVLIGMIWADNKERLDTLLEKESIFIIAVMLILFKVTYGNITSEKWGTICLVCSAILFCICCVVGTYILANTRIIENRVTIWLGEYSLEIYVSQGILLLLRQNDKVYIENPYLFIGITIVGTMIIAKFMKPVYRRIKEFTVS